MSALDRPQGEPIPGSDEWDRFRGWASSFGVSLAARELRLLGVLFEELWTWNRKMNLTGLPTRERILKELILDSVILHGCLPETHRLLDAGTGAGFPGIPLKICRPLVTLHLVEASSRKIGFLRHVLRRTGLEGVRVFHSRLEEASPALDAEGYPMITARAVAPLPKVIPWCAPHLSEGGILVNVQGDRVRETLRAARRAMEEHRLELREIIPYTLPGKESRRHIVLLQKASADLSP